MVVLTLFQSTPLKGGGIRSARSGNRRELIISKAAARMTA
jgi:hypothetical protein